MAQFKRGELVLVETGDRTAPYQVRKLLYDVRVHDNTVIVENGNGSYAYEQDKSSIHKLPKTLAEKLPKESEGK